jgi:hypothetical protein
MTVVISLISCAFDVMAGRDAILFLTFLTFMKHWWAWMIYAILVWIGEIFTAAFMKTFQSHFERVGWEMWEMVGGRSASVVRWIVLEISSGNGP